MQIWKRLTGSVPLRIFAFILFCVVACVAVSAFAYWLYGTQEGYYEQEEPPVFTATVECKRVVFSQLDEVVNAILYYGLIPDLPDHIWQEESCLSYRVLTPNGEVLYDTTQEGDIQAVNDYRLESSAWTSGNETESSGEEEGTATTVEVLDETVSDPTPIEEQNSVAVGADAEALAGIWATSPELADYDYLELQGYIRTPYTGQLLQQHRLYTLLTELKHWFVPVAIGGGVLSVFLLIYLICAAGRKEDQVILTGLNRIPLDLYFVILFLLGLGYATFLDAGPFYYYYGYSSRVAQILLFLPLLLLVPAILCSALGMTLSARLKLPGCWKNTLIYRVFHWFFCLLRRAILAIPLNWKGAICVIGLGLFNVFFIAIAFGNGSGAVFFFCLIVDLLVLLYVLRFLGELRKVETICSKMAAGELDTPMPEKLHFGLNNISGYLDQISIGMNKAVAERMKSERMKTELITNVSHDIKTPLTSIISYIDLLKKENIKGEKAQEYIQVLDRQSQRLKKLTEDVVEASKAATGNLPVSLIRTEVGELLEQAGAEYGESLQAKGLHLVVNKPLGEPAILADSRLISRIFSNLFSNICKYAQEGTRVYLAGTSQRDQVEISLKNISAQVLNISPDELMERFVRGDSSRKTEGSGLGLAIVRSLTELQGGKMTISIDGDLFKVQLHFPRG